MEESFWKRLWTCRLTDYWWWWWWWWYSYLKYIVYDKLLKPQQSFRITLYICLIWRYLVFTVETTRLIDLRTMVLTVRCTDWLKMRSVGWTLDSLQFGGFRLANARLDHNFSPSPALPVALLKNTATSKPQFARQGLYGKWWVQGTASAVDTGRRLSVVRDWNLRLRKEFRKHLLVKWV